MIDGYCDTRLHQLIYQCTLGLQVQAVSIADRTGLWLHLILFNNDQAFFLYPQLENFKRRKIKKKSWIA
jgi:hypothetical protein